LHDIDKDAGEVADGCKNANFACVPEKMDFLQSHGRDSGRRAYNQDGSAGSCTIGHELPEKAVGGRGGHGIHAYGGRHERYVVHHGTGQTDQGDNDVLSSYGLVEPLGQGIKNMGVLQSGNRQEDTYEENDAAHIDSFQGTDHAQVLLELVIFLVAVQEFTNQPEDAKPEENTHERRQLGNCFEDRDSHQDAETQTEH